MNFPQRIVLAFGATAIALMTLFPPWLFVFQAREAKLGERFAGYHPIWEANTPTDSEALAKVFSTNVSYRDLPYFSIRLDTTRLAIQITVTLIFTLLLWAILSNSRRV